MCSAAEITVTLNKALWITPECFCFDRTKSSIGVCQPRRCGWLVWCDLGAAKFANPVYAGGTGYRGPSSVHDALCSEQFCSFVKLRCNFPESEDAGGCCISWIAWLPIAILRMNNFVHSYRPPGKHPPSGMRHPYALDGLLSQAARLTEYRRLRIDAIQRLRLVFAKTMSHSE
jgi:hypothetical protein